MHARRLLAALAAAPLLAAGIAGAQEGGPTPPPPAEEPRQNALTLDLLDTNRNGELSPVEAGLSPSLSVQFPSLDQDGDGTLDEAEFARFELTPTAATGDQPEGSAD